MMRALRAEMIKTRHTHLVVAHLVFSIIAAIFSAVYMWRYPSISAEAKYTLFFDVVATCLPMAICMACVKVAAAEGGRNRCQNILAVYRSRLVPLCAKLVLLLALLVLSLAVFLLVYESLTLLLNGELADLLLVLELLASSLVPALSLYVVDVAVCLRFSAGACVLFSVISSLSSLFLSSVIEAYPLLAYTPWGSEIALNHMLLSRSVDVGMYMSLALTGLALAMILFLLVCIWHNRWEAAR